MAINVNQSLLAILVALENSDQPLTKDQHEALYKMGQRLGAKPKKWSSHLENLLTAFPEDSSFMNFYHQALEALAQLRPEDIAKILPDDQEIKKIFPDTPAVKRVYFEGQADQNSQEICNFVRSVVKSPDPTKTSQKLTLAVRLAKYLKSLDHS